MKSTSKQTDQVAQNTPMLQSESPLYNELKQTLFKVAASWSNADVWPNIWSNISEKARNYGLDERVVRRQMRAMWDEHKSAIIQIKLSELKAKLEKERLELKNTLKIENHNNRHLSLLRQWLRKLPSGKWNYVQWDDFLDSLKPPIDIALLESERDSIDSIIYTDKLTGLMWIRNANFGLATYLSQASSFVNSLKYGGYSDWRLPTLDELHALATRGGEKPSKWFNKNDFTEVQAGRYLTCETFDGDRVYYVDFTNGHQGTAKYGNGFVWPVRGTKLSWFRNANSADGPMKWLEAMRFAETSVGGNEYDVWEWRLPTKSELEALAIRGGERPAEWLTNNDSAYFQVQASWYWTSSTDDDNINNVWCINMLDGKVYSRNKNLECYVWLVRTCKY